MLILYMSEEYYRQKYLKYKIKYLDLQEQMGGAGFVKHQLGKFFNTEGYQRKRKAEKEAHDTTKKEAHAAAEKAHDAKVNERENRYSRAIIITGIQNLLTYNKQYTTHMIKNYYENITDETLKKFGSYKNGDYVFKDFKDIKEIIKNYFPKYNESLTDYTEILKNLKSQIYFPNLTKDEYKKLLDIDKEKYKDNTHPDDTVPSNQHYVLINLDNAYELNTYGLKENHNK